jgi:hypothetical protein
LRFLFLIFYLILLLIAYFRYFRATRGHYKNKYLDYRALAEGLRMQFFWRLAGLPDTVATHYLRKQKSELDWIRNSIRVANLLCDARSGEKRPTDSSVHAPDDRYRPILKQWVNDQGAYFTLATTRDHRKSGGNEQWVRILFRAGLALAVVLGILQLLLLLPRFPLQYQAWMSTPLTNLFIVTMSLVLALAALREGYGDKIAYAEQAKHYQRMNRLFWLASQRLKDSLEQGKLQGAAHVIRELGEEALAENGDWVMLHRTRPINVPMGG